MLHHETAINNLEKRNLCTKVFLGSKKNHRITPQNNSVRLLLTKKPRLFLQLPPGNWRKGRGTRFLVWTDPAALSERVGPVSGPFHCADSSLRRARNTTRRRLGLGPDRMESYPLLAVRKPAPTVSELGSDTYFVGAGTGIGYAKEILTLGHGFRFSSWLYVEIFLMWPLPLATALIFCVSSCVRVRIFCSTGTSLLRSSPGGSVRN